MNGEIHKLAAILPDIHQADGQALIQIGFEVFEEDSLLLKIFEELANSISAVESVEFLRLLIVIRKYFDYRLPYRLDEENYERVLRKNIESMSEELIEGMVVSREDLEGEATKGRDNLVLRSYIQHTFVKNEVLNRIKPTVSSVLQLHLISIIDCFEEENN